jgi:hypothetical protein
MPFIPNPAGGEFIEVTQEEYNNWVDAQFTASSGQVVKEEARARAPDATASTPADEPLVEIPGTPPDDNTVETGTNGRIRKTIETQATPPADTNNGEVAYTTTQAGAGADSEDSGKATKNSTATSIDATFGSAPIVPQPNILDQYASYTYQFSLYLMKPDDYRAMIVNKKKKILPGPQLLIQSGGAPVGGRNTYFSNDYYIDKVTLRSAITGKGTNAAHNVNDIKMTIIEPSGITLLGNLDKAVQGYLGGAANKKKNFTSAVYLLVLRFYGYDDAGNLVRGGNPTPTQGGGGQGGAFVEKYYPITLNKINFKVANKIVEYEIEATAVQTTVAAGSARGTIPYNVELGAMTVGEALNGPVDITPSRTETATTATTATKDRETTNVAESQDATATAATPPPTAASAKNPKITVRRGLAEALNQFQRELVNKGVYTYPDTYTIEFTDTALSQASIQVKNPEITATASAPPTTAAQAKNPETNSTDFKTRNISVIAGNQIVQLIDTVMKNSTYITAQALVTKSEAGTGKQQPNTKPGNNIATYKINMTAVPKPDKYDSKRNDYAYDIKYTISPYKVVGLVSDYFPLPKYNGVHKQYNYWFTGENTQVLSYEQTYNALYYAVLSGSQNQQVGTIVQDTMKTSYQPRSGESSQGAKNGVNEIGANFTDYLYSPGDLANATIQIIGDPAWLQQGDIDPVSKGNFKSGPFMPDGTINYDSQQILFEILINTPGDYNLETGIIDPNVRNTVFNTGRRPGATKQSYIYIANDCVSEFNKGSFKQVVKGSLLSYLPDQTFKQQQQQNSRPVGAAAIPGAAGNRTAANGRITNNPGATENNGEWDTSSGVGILKEDLPTDNTEESDPISIPEPQPQPDPENPTSDGDLEPISDEYSDQPTESPDAQYQQDNASVEEPDYNSGLAGTTAPSQLMDRET